MDKFDKLLKLNQYGLLITQRNGHFYIEYETDYELSPTDESKELLRKLSENGVSLQYKWYGNFDEVYSKIDKVLKFLNLEDVYVDTHNLNEVELANLELFKQNHSNESCKIELEAISNSVGTKTVAKCVTCGSSEDITDYNCW